jgi:ADP-heptose:LPS heptosyltransferase
MNEDQIKHILVIRFRRVGDAILTSAVCSSLRKTFPNAQIDYVVNDGIDSLFRNHPDVDRLITFSAQENHSLFRYLLKVWRIMRATPYDIIIDTRSTVRTLSFSLFSLRSKFRIGVAKKYNLGIQNHPVKVRALKDVNIIQWLLFLLTPLTAQFDVQQTEKFQLFPDSKAVDDIHQAMTKAGVDFTKPVVFVAATTRIKHKMWSAKKMAIVLQRLVDEYDCQLIFNATGVESALLNEIKSHMRDDRNWFSNIPAPSLGDLSALIKNCHLFFGNEGGPRHIAQALGVPSLAIFPPNTSAAKWLPNPSAEQQAITVDATLQDAHPSELSDWLSVEDVWLKLAPFVEMHSARATQQTQDS